MNNSTKILDAFKSELPKRTEIVKKQNEIKETFNIVRSNISQVLDIYNLVFKNINPDKKEVCEITEFSDEDTYYKEEIKNYCRKLFLNRDGFSVSDSYKKDRVADISRTIYIDSFGEKKVIKIFKILFKHKDDILKCINKEYKKSVAIRFFEAFEKSDCDKILSDSIDFDYLKKEFELSPKIYYYNNDTIEKIDIKFLQIRNAGNHVTVNQDGKYSYNTTNINLDELDKVSQIYEEIITFLEQYHQRLKEQDTCLLKFHTILRDSFAKELILNSLKEKEK